MILVTGAAGKTGRAVLQALVARGQPVRCLVRRGDAGDTLRQMGARDIHLGSMDDEGALRDALQGCRAVYHIAPNVDEGEDIYAATLLRAAADAGPLRVVYHSVLHPQIEAMPHHWAKLRVEERILASALPFTILRPTAYMQNLLPAVAQARATALLVVPYPVETRLSLIDLADVGEAAACVLCDDAHAYACYDLAGTPPMDQTQVAAVVTGVLGRTVTAFEQPLAGWDEQAASAGLSDHARDVLRQMFQAYAAQGLPGNSLTLQQVLGRAPTSLAAMLRRHLVEP